MTKDTTQTTAHPIPRIISVDRIMSSVIGVPISDLSHEDRVKLERVGFYVVNDLSSYFVSESGYNAGDRDLRVEFGGKSGLIKNVDPRNSAVELELIQALFNVRPSNKPTIQRISTIGKINIMLDRRSYPSLMQPEFKGPISKAVNSIINGEVLLRNHTNAHTMTSYGVWDSSSKVSINASVILSNGAYSTRDLTELSEYKEIGERFLQVIKEAYDETLSRLQFDQTAEFEYSQIEEGVLA